MIVHLKIIGWLLIILSLIHVFFPYYFKWKSDFQSVTLLNRQVMYVHTLFIGITVFLMGLLIIYYPKDLIHTKLGNGLCLGLAIFWGIRLLIQFFGYSSKLWKGKTPETVIHLIFIVLFFYLTFVFGFLFIQHYGH